MERAVAVGVIVAMLNACSFGTTGAPDHPRAGVPLDCTSSYTAPGVDVTVAAIGLAGGIYLAAGPECPERDGSEPCDAFAGHLSRGFGGLLVLIGVAYGFASLVGFSRVGSCKQALAAAAPR